MRYESILADRGFDYMYTLLLSNLVEGSGSGGRPANNVKFGEVRVCLFKFNVYKQLVGWNAATLWVVKWMIYAFWATILVRKPSLGPF